MMLAARVRASLAATADDTVPYRSDMRDVPGGMALPLRS